MASSADGFAVLKVSAGSHRVERRYEPLSFRLGLFVGLMTLTGLAIASTSGGGGGTRVRPSPGPSLYRN
jgi:hypothetical protein